MTNNFRKTSGKQVYVSWWSWHQKLRPGTRSNSVCQEGTELIPVSFDLSSVIPYKFCFSIRCRNERPLCNYLIVRHIIAGSSDSLDGSQSHSSTYTELGRVTGIMRNFSIFDSPQTLYFIANLQNNYCKYCLEFTLTSIIPFL